MFKKGDRILGYSRAATGDYPHEGLKLLTVNHTTHNDPHWVGVTPRINGFTALNRHMGDIFFEVGTNKLLEILFGAKNEF